MEVLFCIVFGWLWSGACAAPEQEVSLPRDIAPVEDRGVTREDQVYPIAPDIFPGMEWISQQRFDSLGELHGKVVMVDFWTLGCINCQRALPHVVDLYDKYKNEGFVVIGVHAPEFAYERKRENIIASIEKFGITYPVVLDNDFRIWKNYNNRYWPAQYIIGRDGTLRHHYIGEGAYEEMDHIVQQLLKEKL